MRVAIPPDFGGSGSTLIVGALNDTGSSIMTLFYHEAFNLGWQPVLTASRLVSVRTVDAMSLQESIYILAQVCSYDGVPITDWFVELFVLRRFTGSEIRLSGSGVRDQLYISTVPRMQELYVARSKGQLSQILPGLDQLPPFP